MKLKIDTSGYGGRRMVKKVKIKTDDPRRPWVVLNIAGTVEKFVTISPPSIRLMGPVGQPLKTTVSIVPEKKYPFKIVDTKAQYGKFIRYRLETIPSPNGPAYEMTVENLKASKGRFFDVIYLKTDSDIRPQIRLNVYGRIGS